MKNAEKEDCSTPSNQLAVWDSGGKKDLKITMPNLELR